MDSSFFVINTELVPSGAELDLLNAKLRTVFLEDHVMGVSKVGHTTVYSKNERKVQKFLRLIIATQFWEAKAILLPFKFTPIQFWFRCGARNFARSLNPNLVSVQPYSQEHLFLIELST